MVEIPPKDNCSRCRAGKYCPLPGHEGNIVAAGKKWQGPEAVDKREKMRVVGKEELLEPLNRSALKIAKKVALDTPKGIEPNLMAGNISNSNIWNDKDTSSNSEVEKMFSEMVGLKKLI